MTSFHPTSPAVGAPISGIRYQVRLFWLHALPMLYGNGNSIESVAMEVPNADGIDDVMVIYNGQGITDRGSPVDADFIQVKHHVAHTGVIDYAFFVDPSRTKTKKPLMKRLADTWLKRREQYPHCRLQFITNWSWDPHDPLRKHIRDNGRIGERAFNEKPGSEVGKALGEWRSASGLDDEQFAEFLPRLRFWAPWSSSHQAAEDLRARMYAAGLSLPERCHECIPLDDLGSRFLEDGRTCWTANDLEVVLRRENLFAPPCPTPRLPLVCIRSFTRAAGLGLISGDVDIDLTDLFDGRFPNDNAAWGREIPSRVSNRFDDVLKLQQPVEIALDCHYSIAWHAGRLFDSKSGVRLLIHQKVPNAGIQLWDPSAADSTGSTWVISDEGPSGAEQLVIIVSATHAIRDDVIFQLASLGLEDAHIIHFGLEREGGNAIMGAGHAVALASDLISNVRALTRTARPRITHVFLATPVALAFLLGQRSGALGRTTVYEFDFEGNRTYSPGTTLPVSTT